jgi:hypothetical protein
MLRMQAKKLRVRVMRRNPAKSAAPAKRNGRAASSLNPIASFSMLIFMENYLLKSIE